MSDSSRGVAAGVFDQKKTSEVLTMIVRWVIVFALIAWVGSCAKQFMSKIPPSGGAPVVSVFTLTPSENEPKYWLALQRTSLRSAVVHVKQGAGSTAWIVFPSKAGVVNYDSDGRVRFIFPDGHQQEATPLTRWRIDHRESAVRIENLDTHDVTIRLTFRY